MVLPISAAKSRLGQLQSALTFFTYSLRTDGTSMIMLEAWTPPGFELDLAPACYFGLIPNA
jgi:hypothetical protein